MMIFLTLSLVSRTASNSGMDDITGYLITLFFVTVAGGFIFSLLSIKEPNSWRKLVALVVNIGLFLMLLINVFRNI